MLPAEHRLTRSADFRVATRRGVRSRRGSLVAHLWVGPGDRSARVGLVVSKAVGAAVVRTRVKRRLRHVAREQLSLLPGSSVLVVRALPAAADATSAQLGEDLAAALGRCLEQVPVAAP